MGRKKGGQQMGKERRKFKRFDAFMSVKYKTGESVTLKGISLSKDLSRDGLKIITNQQVKEGTLLDLEIDIPDDPRPIQTTGRVQWCVPSPHEKNEYECGIQFVMMDPVDKFRALDYAYNHWLETKVNDFADPEDIPDVND